MRRWMLAATAAATLAAHPAMAQTPSLPQPVTAIIDAAADDPDALQAVVKAAKKADPASAAAIDAYVADLTARAAARKAAIAAQQTFFQGWTGKGELGGSISTGNTNDSGGVIALGLDKATPRWNHDLNLSVDYKREDGKTTKDRYFLGYSLQRKFTPRFYAVAVLWGERDRFAGYNYRFSESLDLGYRLLDGAKLKLRVEAGPAIRQADYLVNGYETTFAGRGAGYFTWRIGPRLEFTQSLVGYLESKNPTLLASSVLTQKLQGNLSARASYEVRYEQDPPDDREKTDTTTRLTLVFNF